jgi:heme-degrading monooxygenase HmoA
MIIVHDIFICKPGNASKVARLFKEVMSGQKEVVSILTDLTGEFNRVIMVTQWESLSAWEKSWETMNSEEGKKMQEKMKGYTDLYQTGKREIFRMW